VGAKLTHEDGWKNMMMLIWTSSWLCECT